MKLPTLFNPSNDMALAAGIRQYFPPKRIQCMEADLAELSRYWEEGPWGWSLATKLRYEKMGIPPSELPSDEWLAEVRRLSSREFAANYIRKMLSEMGSDDLVGGDMTFISKTEFMAGYTLRGDVQQIFKSPWSSSGRGVFTSLGQSSEQIVHKLEGFINTQGGFLADTFYNKEMDFAMEFFVHSDHRVDFLGYSVFEAAESGAYGYNCVESQEGLIARIGLPEGLLEAVKQYHIAHLGQMDYEGPVGIDMLKCKDGRLHCCIEINLRMNMGILSILLYERFGRNASVQLTPQREHGFEAVIDNGKLKIIYKR